MLCRSCNSVCCPPLVESLVPNNFQIVMNIDPKFKGAHQKARSMLVCEIVISWIARLIRWSSRTTLLGLG